ncbi:MAG: type IV pilus biogenesis/stability protein PilW [Burkholderiaceae bacterium]|nr:type IV pilus biogenesis/stability protein PilW [Burkholderiaceae bacterium]
MSNSKNLLLNSPYQFRTMTSDHRWARKVFFIACLLFLCVLLGCADTMRSSGSKSDILTASDETDGQKRAKIRLELALGYLEQGQVTIALDETKQAIIADSSSADGYNLRGLIYMRLNDLDLARDSFAKALALAPRDGNIFHNYGWLFCQETRYSESLVYFDKALASSGYIGQAKTLLAKGICQLRMGDKGQAESSFLRSFELDAGNPITTFNLASLLFQRKEVIRAQFYIRRLNSSDFANAESLWLAAKIEKKLGNNEGVMQLVDRLKKRFAGSYELTLFERGAFNE